MYRWKMDDVFGDNKDDFATLYCTVGDYEMKYAEVKRDIKDGDEYMFRAEIALNFSTKIKPETFWAKDWDEVKTDIVDYIVEGLENDRNWLNDIIEAFEAE